MFMANFFLVIMKLVWLKACHCHISKYGFLSLTCMTTSYTT